jgi:GT2 family glycosyltransferase
MSLDFAVVICAYATDRWDRLVAAVRSVQRQTLPPREVLVVVDHNRALLDRARRELNGVRVLENVEARGLRGARNSGVYAATASCVAFMDDDAEACQEWLERLAGPYDDPDVAGVGGFTHPVWDGGRPGWFPPEFEWIVGGAYRGMSPVYDDVRNLWGGNMSFRRKLVVRAGGFRIGYSCDDTELCIRLRQRWPRNRFVLVPEARVLHHVERSRMTVRRFLSRCYFEGGSKAVISRLVGAADGLASERRYAREVLPAGIKHAVVDVARGSGTPGIARAALIVAGLGSAAAGYTLAHVTPMQAANKRGWSGEALGAMETVNGFTG